MAHYKRMLLLNGSVIPFEFQSFFAHHKPYIKSLLLAIIRALEIFTSNVQ